MRPTEQEILKHNLEITGPEPTFFAQYQSQTIAQWFAHLQTQPITIVDVGCADGLLTSFIAAHFSQATVHGVDVSTEHIEVARLAYPYLLFHEYPLSALGNNAEVSSSSVGLASFPNSSVDLVIMADTLHHIPTEQHAALIAEIMRVLKPGGVCCILEPNPYNLCTRYRFVRNPEEIGAYLIQPQKLRSLMQPYGNTRTVFYHFFTQKLHKLRTYEKYLAWLPCGQLYACITTKK